MAAPVPHLSQTPIDIQALRDNSRRELLDCLDAAGSPAQVRFLLYCVRVSLQLSLPLNGGSTVGEELICTGSNCTNLSF
jgi:hypothetical protein